jgi:hypothetical protein
MLLVALPDHLKRKLNFPGLRCCGHQNSRRTFVGRIQLRPGAVKNVRIVRHDGKCKIGVIENIENFGSELHIEGFGNPSNVIVLEQGDVQVHQSRTRYAIATGVASKIEALQRIGVY